MRVRTFLVSGIVITAVAAIAYELGRSDQREGVTRTAVPAVYAADANTYVGLDAGTVLPQDRQVVSPTGVVEDRDTYYPGTEALEPDEMRVIACGTGMPNARPGLRRHRRGPGDLRPDQRAVRHQRRDADEGVLRAAGASGQLIVAGGMPPITLVAFAIFLAGSSST